MTKDAKAVERQRLAEALRANLRRRKAAQGQRVAHEEVADGARGSQTADANQGTR